MNNKTDFKDFLNSNLSVTEIMEKTNLTRPTVLKFVKGDLNKLNVYNLKKLCDCFDIKVYLDRPFLSDGKIVDSVFYDL